MSVIRLEGSYAGKTISQRMNDDGVAPLGRTPGEGLFPLLRHLAWPQFAYSFRRNTGRVFERMDTAA